MSAVTISNVRPHAAGALRGFCDVRHPSGMTLHGCTIFAKDGRAWAAPPGRPILGRDETAQRDAAGKVRYDAVASFADRATRERWSAAVIDAVRALHPEVLA